MADWDPFAIDTNGAEATPPTTAGTTNGDEIKKLQTNDIDRIIAQAHDKIAKDQKWLDMETMCKPDLSVHKPCGKEDWKHTAMLLEFGDQIAYLILNRPDKDNVIDDEISLAWADAVYKLHHRPDIRVVVLMARGTVFCGGGDLTMPAKDLPADVQKARQDLAKRATESGLCDGDACLDRLLGCKALWNFHTLPQLTVGIVSGSVLGGGLGLICACDTVISVKSALYVMSDVKQGLVPALSMPYLTMKVGLGLAKKNLQQGLSRTAEEAKADKMVQYVVEDMTAAAKKLDEICANSTALAPAGVSKVKSFITSLSGRQVNMEILYYSITTLQELLESPEVKSSDDAPWAGKKITPLDMNKLKGK